MAGLPSLAGMFGGGGGGSHGNLTNDQILLYRDVERWLANARGRFVENRHVELSNPVGSHQGGIKCEVLRASKPNKEFFDMFKAYDAGCSDLLPEMDDELGRNVYHVFIPFPRDGRLSDLQATGRGGGGFWWPAFLDEPRVIITGLMVTAVSAAFTTKWSQWMSFAASVLGGQ